MITVTMQEWNILTFIQQQHAEGKSPNCNAITVGLNMAGYNAIHNMLVKLQQRGAVHVHIGLDGARVWSLCNVPIGVAP